MSGTPYTPEDLAYIQGRSVCYSAIDKIHGEMWGLRFEDLQAATGGEHGAGVEPGRDRRA